jgi:esterase/lipase
MQTNAPRTGIGFPRRVVKWLKYLAVIAFTIVATVVVMFALQARARLPDLRAWHTVELDNEFRHGKADAPDSFTEYRALEDKLFAELHSRIIDNAETADVHKFSRYNPTSVVSKLALNTVYNRSFELAPTGKPRGSALLVHGLTDSPYSMRALAETLVAQGYYVVALRMPGHGTLPSGLVDVSWEDWYAAAVIAAKHAIAQGGENNPFLAAGHSTGSALLALYSLRAIKDSSLPKPQQLHLISAAIGISPFAVLTNVISELAFVPGLEKSKWMDVLPEYDPYKYNSFPVNAANQIYKLTHAVQDELNALTPEQLTAMPRVHMYQSIVDSTVTSNEVVHGLLGRLPARGHELFVFDINRHERTESLIAAGPLDDLERLRTATGLPFRIALVANRSRDTRAVATYTREAGAKDVSIQELPLEWPIGVFSVGHVALPFPSDDPVYGLTSNGEHYNLGSIAVKGESGALIVGLGTFARLRSNPFFDVIKQNVIATLDPAPSIAANAP